MSYRILVARTSTGNDVDYFVLWRVVCGTSGIMYDEILGDTITVGTMIPTPPRRSAEALSRRTLLWICGRSQIVSQTIHKGPHAKRCTGL